MLQLNVPLGLRYLRRQGNYFFVRSKVPRYVSPPITEPMLRSAVPFIVVPSTLPLKLIKTVPPGRFFSAMKETRLPETEPDLTFKRIPLHQLPCTRGIAPLKGPGKAVAGLLQRDIHVGGRGLSRVLAAHAASPRPAYIRAACTSQHHYQQSQRKTEPNICLMAHDLVPLPSLDERCRPLYGPQPNPLSDLLCARPLPPISPAAAAES